jgi:hypothetical protein
MERLYKAPVRVNGIELVTVKQTLSVGAKREKIVEQRNKMLLERKLTLQEKDSINPTEPSEKP